MIRRLHVKANFYTVDEWNYNKKHTALFYKLAIGIYTKIKVV
jgi:hypothetical protein